MQIEKKATIVLNQEEIDILDTILAYVEESSNALIKHGTGTFYGGSFQNKDINDFCMRMRGSL